MSRRGLAALTLGAALLLCPREARADDFSGAAEGVVILVGIFGVLVVTDVGLATANTVMAANHSVPGTAYGVFETAFGGLQSGVGLYWFATSRGDAMAAREGDAALAMTTLPLAISMHGLWSVTTAYDSFPWAVVPAAAADAIVVGTDVLRMVQHRRQEEVHWLFEVVAGVPQVGFGVAQAAGGRKQDVGATLGFTALPALMVLHGIYEAVASPPHEDDTARGRTPAPSWALVPAAPAAACGLSVVGAF